MKKLVVAFLLVAAFTAQAPAQFGCSGPGCPATTQLPAVTQPALPPAGVINPQPPIGPSFQPNLPAGQQIGVTHLPAPVILQSPPPPAPASFSFGTLGAELLAWIAAVFGPVIATFLTKWAMAVAKRAGIETSAAMSDKLDLIIQNGIMNGAHTVGADMKGRLNVNVRNQIVAQAITYAKAHGADTIKDLANSKSSLAFLKNFDPNDPRIQEALQARAAKVLNDVSAPDAVTKPPATTGDAPVTPPGGPAAPPQAAAPAAPLPAASPASGAAPA